jgi:site-specific DNA recombinase
MPTRVSTLTRRSTDEQHQPFSIELQDTKLAAYIKSQDDWTLVRKDTDNKAAPPSTALELPRSGGHMNA